MPGWQPLVICGRTIREGVGGNLYTHECTFADFIQLINNGIQDLVILSTLIAVAVFCYAGIILLTSGGNPSAFEKAKKMLWKVVLGYLWILGAWLVVYTITSVLLKPGPDYTILQPPRP